MKENATIKILNEIENMNKGCLNEIKKIEENKQSKTEHVERIAK